MKRTLVFLTALFFASGLGSAARSGSQSAQPAAGPPSATPVVVELFTSEGCSSCPPADALLAKMETAQPFTGVHIIAIEEHVDYWNQQGWVDPFSSIEWTDRQQVYTTALHQQGPYTPQMVVNGRAQLVGSRTDQAVQAVEAAQGNPATLVKIAPVQGSSPGEPRFTVSVARIAQLAPGDSAEVWLAITESGLSSQVSRGENAGRNLSHASVLRSIRRIGSADARAENSFEGEAFAKLKSNWKRENLTAVVLLQEKKSRRILGATSQKIAN
ncbi:MAG TPA: DUF1223 domain-containing protein [Candidatus Acidoferrum sp.]|nr:DUF1223 domain-containing protein [Candidatus Acidoferrum sp.]